MADLFEVLAEDEDLWMPAEKRESIDDALLDEDYEDRREREVQRILREANIAHQTLKAFLDPQNANLPTISGQNSRTVLAKAFVMAWSILATGHQPEVNHETGSIRWCRGSIGPGRRLLSQDEVVAYLRKIISGEVEIRLADDGSTWSYPWGHVRFIAGDWDIVFFNDAGEMDYIDSIDTSDACWEWGECVSYERGVGFIGDPFELLSAEELQQLEQKLEQCDN